MQQHRAPLPLGLSCSILLHGVTVRVRINTVLRCVTWTLYILAWQCIGFQDLPASKQNSAKASLPPSCPFQTCCLATKQCCRAGVSDQTVHHTRLISPIQLQPDLTNITMSETHTWHACQRRLEIRLDLKCCFDEPMQVWWLVVHKDTETLRI
jgi:hypothetical protein